MALPAHLATGLITGNFARWTVDGDDDDREPDVVALPGLEITLTAEVIPKTPVAVIHFPTAVPPTTYIVDPIVATTDSNGVLVDPSGKEGVRVVSNELPGSNPNHWVWRAVVRKQGVLIAEKTFSVPVNGTVNLTSVIPVAEGTPLPAWWTALEALRVKVEQGGGGSNPGTGTPPVVPSIAGLIQHGGTVQSMVLDTTGVAVGEWMIATMVLGSTSTNLLVPAGWTVLQPQVNTGSRRMMVVGRVKESGDAASVLFSKDAAAGTWRVALLHGRGAKSVAGWTVGPAGQRADASKPVNNAPSVLTTIAGSLMVAVSAEATTTSETGIVSVTGASQYAYAGQDTEGPTGVIETVWYGQREYLAPAVTDVVAVTYPNVAGSATGLALQIILPPAVEGTGGSGGTGEGGPITADKITDASVVGRTILKAVDAPAVRLAAGIYTIPTGSAVPAVQSGSIVIEVG